jgi:hypothetical protein
MVWPPQELPIELATENPVTAVSAGGAHSLLLRADGRVWSMGDNFDGQLGDTQKSNTWHYADESPATAVDGVRSMTAAYSASIAVREDGSVWGWGNNSGFLGAGFQLGVADSADQLTPVRASFVQGLVAKVVSTSGGWGPHTHALMEDGRVLSWGTNYKGLLGAALPDDGAQTTRDRWKPVLVKPTWLVDDRDGDGLSSFDELWLYHTDHTRADSNGDGIMDGAAIALGIDAMDTDMDDDELLNAYELAHGTDPFSSDSDGDGIADAVDPYPLSGDFDPNPPGTGAPTIYLHAPSGATLVESLP